MKTQQKQHVNKLPQVTIIERKTDLIFPEGYEPVVMETTVLKKFLHGSKKTVLPAEGERTHPLILFSKNAIQFEGMTLEKLENNPVFIGSLLEKVRP